MSVMKGWIDHGAEPLRRAAGLRKLLIASLVGTSLTLIPSAAYASCAPPPAIEEAIETSNATFVGTVSAVENYRRWATVDVDEIWNGQVDQSQVVVKGGPKDPAGDDHVVTSVDRSYRVGETYLFVVYEGDGSVFRDNICSSTTTFTPELARLRPASASASPSPEAEPDEVQGEDSEPLGSAVPLGMAAVALVGVSLWVFLRKRG